MSDVHAYRGSDDLAAALRDYRDRDAEFCRGVVEFDREHPGHEVLWARSPFSAQQFPRGFRDGEETVPAGLSRAKSRTALAPRRGETGKPWREVLARMEKRPSIEQVWRDHDIPMYGEGPGNGRGGQYIAITQWFDAGDDGAIVVCGYDIGVDRNGEPNLSEHLTPMPLSEYYRIRETLEAAEAAAGVR